MRRVTLARFPAGRAEGSGHMVIVLLLCCVALLALAWRSGQKAWTAKDFFLAGRSLEPGLVGLSQASNALPLWLLVAVAGAAFAWGLAAAWILGAALVGYAFGWFFVAPRLRAWSLIQDHLTLPQLLTGDTGRRLRGPAMLSAASILFIAILVGMAAYLPILGQLLAGFVPVSARTGMLLGIAGATLCALLGGYRGACLNDGVRAIAVLLIVIGVAAGALIAAGGWSPTWSKLVDLPGEAGILTAEQAAILAVTFALGTLVLGVMPFGQPQVVSRYMASSGPAQLPIARRIALLWALLVLGAMLVCGWTARLLLPAATTVDAVFPELLQRVLPSGIATVGLGALFVIAFSALDSILLVMAAAVSVDVMAPQIRGSLDWPKPAVVLAGALLAAVALTVPEPTFERLMLSWTLLSSAFGPLLLVRLTGKRVRPGSTLGSMWAGFILTLLLHLLPNAPGDFLERALPFVAALGIALTGGERRRDPDRADRAEHGAASAAEQ